MSLAEEFGVRKENGFTVDVSGDDDRRVLQPRGQLDLATADQLQPALLAAFESGAQTIVLDLSRLDFMDSTGVHLAHMAVRLASERGQEFFLLRGPAHVQRPFDLAGIADQLPFAD